MVWFPEFDAHASYGTQPAETGAVADGICPTLPLFRSVAGRSLGRVRRRYLRARASPPAHADCPITLESGETLQAPSDDETIPAERGAPSTLPPPFDRIRDVTGPTQVAPMEAVAFNVQTPKREGPLPEEYARRVALMILQGEIPQNLFGLVDWRDKTVFSDVTQDDLGKAVRFPLLGWPDFAHFFMGVDGTPLPHLIFDAAP